MQKRGSLLRAARVAQLRGVERSAALCAVWRWKVGQLCYCCAVACCGVKKCLEFMRFVGSQLGSTNCA